MEAYRKWIVRLLIFEVALGVLQVPLYVKTGATEEIIGTFYGNAEQYQGFVMVAVFYLLGRIQLESENRRRLWLQIGGILCLLVLIDNKASWLGLTIGMLAVLHAQESRSLLWLLRPRYLMPICAMFTVAALLAIHFSPSMKKMRQFADVLGNGEWHNLGKVKAYEDILSSFMANPHMLFVGSGPGNFYSRSGRQFYALGMSLGESDVRNSSAFASRKSNSMGNVIKMTGRDPFYEKYYLTRDIFRIGSGQVDSPFSSYAGLVGECGIVGFIVYISIYFRMCGKLRRSLSWFRIGDETFYPLAVASFGFMIYILTESLYNSWLETGRMTSIVWSMTVICLRRRFAIDSYGTFAASADNSCETDGCV